jgi:hypothetical protein
VRGKLNLKLSSDTSEVESEGDRAVGQGESGD